MFIVYTLLGILVIAALTVLVIVRSARKHGPAIEAAQREFFTRTGYRYPELPAGSLDEQVKFTPPGRFDVRTGRVEQRFVRSLADGEVVDFHSVREGRGTKVVKRLDWRRTLATPPAVKLQIADRELPELGKLADRKVLAPNKTRSWRAEYPGPIPTGDAAIDGRFYVYSTDAAAALRCLAAPGLRDLLLAHEEVDVLVTDGDIRFADPESKNLRADREGGGLDPAPAILSSIPVHERVQRTLETLRDAVR